MGNSGFNLSYESLNSREARVALNDLAQKDPKLYAALTEGQDNSVDTVKGPVAEDEEEALDAIEDSSLPINDQTGYTRGHRALTRTRTRTYPHPHGG